MNLYVHPNGTIRCLYSETLNLSKLGYLTIQRASNVEYKPDPATPTHSWHVDLTPIGIPIISSGFPCRSKALQCETEQLEFILSQEKL
jgi:hypothetical protein